MHWNALGCSCRHGCAWMQNLIIAMKKQAPALSISHTFSRGFAGSLAACIAPAELSPEYIVPSVFNREVVRRVATAVRAAAIKAGVARKAS